MEAQDFVAALVKKGMTQQQIAAETEIPQPTLSKVLRGDVKDVLSRNYRKLKALYEDRIGPVADGAADAGTEVEQLPTEH